MSTWVYIYPTLLPRRDKGSLKGASLSTGIPPDRDFSGILPKICPIIPSPSRPGLQFVIHIPSLSRPGLQFVFPLPSLSRPGLKFVFYIPSLSRPGLHLFTKWKSLPTTHPLTQLKEGIGGHLRGQFWLETSQGANNNIPSSQLTLGLVTVEDQLV